MATFRYTTRQEQRPTSDTSIRTQIICIVLNVRVCYDDEKVFNWNRCSDGVKAYFIWNARNDVSVLKLERL